MLEINNLRVAFGGAAGPVRAVSGVDLRVDRGEIVGVVGESGCGKTVTALAAMGLLPFRGQAEGEILLDGEDLLRKTNDEMRAIRGNCVSMIFQEPMTALNPLITIGRQLCEPLALHRGMPPEESMRQAAKALDMVRVPSAASRLKNYPHQLSGGLCQRVMIAMALICEPELLIADEPTTALDVTIQAQILDLLRDLRARTGTAILMITHDLGVVAELCDRVCVMYAGRLMEHAEVFELFGNPRHPYTSGLLKSLPRVDARPSAGEKLYSIPGMVPNLRGLPAGCPFEPRCDEAMEKCKREVPPLFRTADGHASRCWRSEGTPHA